MMFYEGLRFLLCVAGTGLICYFFDGLFSRRNLNNWLRLSYIMIASVMIFMINGFGVLWLNISLVFFIYCVVIMALFEVKVYDAVSYGAVVFVTLSTIEPVFELFLNFAASYLNVPSRDLVGRIYLWLLTVEFLCRFIYVKVFKYYISKLPARKSANILWQLLIVQITIGMVLISYFYIGFPEKLEIQILVCIGALLLYLINGVIFIMLVRYSNVLSMEKKRDLALTRSKAEQHSYEQLKRKNEEYQKYFHDIKKHLRVMENLAQKNQNEQLLELSYQLVEKEQEISRNSYSSNYILEAVLQERVHRAKQLGVNFQVDISPGTYIDFIKSLDLITMFGNLLDNALEGAAEVKAGFVDVKMYTVSDSYVALKITNPYKHRIRRQGNRLLTTKEKETSHGIGLENTKEVAAKYGGFLKIEAEGHKFTIVLMLSESANSVENESI